MAHTEPTNSSTIKSCTLWSLRLMLLFFCTLACINHIVNVLFTLSNGAFDRAITEKFGLDMFGLSPGGCLVGISLNILMIPVTFFGCYGAYHLHHKSLKYYTTFNTIVTVVLLLIALLIFNPSTLEGVNNNLKEEYRSSMSSYSWVDGTGSSKLDLLQKNGRCCGIDGPQDWDRVRPFLVPNNVYPRSCCSDDPMDKSVCRRNSFFFHEEGCIEIMRLVEKVITVTIAAYTVFQLFLCVIAMVLVHHAPKSATTHGDRLIVDHEAGQVYDNKQQPANVAYRRLHEAS